jgi:hypothetical protein
VINGHPPVAVADLQLSDGNQLFFPDAPIRAVKLA